jgi:hypothetical protein
MTILKVASLLSALVVGAAVWVYAAIPDAAGSTAALGLLVIPLVLVPLLVAIWVGALLAWASKRVRDDVRNAQEAERRHISNTP